MSQARPSLDRKADQEMGDKSSSNSPNSVFTTYAGRKNVAENFVEHLKNHVEDKKHSNVEDNKSSSIATEHIEKAINHIKIYGSSSPSIRSTEKGLHTVTNPFSEAIMELNLLADQEEHIQSRYIPFKSGKKSTPVLALYRDATKQKEEKNKATKQKKPYANWAIQGLNYFNSTIKLLEVVNDPAGKLDEAGRKYLAMMAEKFLAAISKSKHPQYEISHMEEKVLIPYLVSKLKVDGKGVDKKTAKKWLKEARAFSNFEQPTFVVATQSTINVVEHFKKNHGTAVENLDVDVPMTGNLTEIQKDQYQRLANSNTDETQLNNISWFANQKPHIKKLIRHHAQDVLDGRMISTQLRKYFAGVRNGGQEFIYLKNNKSSTTINEFQCVFEAYHSGNPSHEFDDSVEDKDDSTKNQKLDHADRESVQQLGQLTEADHVIVCDLTTDLNLPGLEGGKKGVNPRTRNAIAEINTQSHEKKVVHEEGAQTDTTKTTIPEAKISPKFHHSNLTAHQSRVVLPNIYDGLDFIRTEAAEVIQYVEQKNLSNSNPTSLPEKIKANINKGSTIDYNNEMKSSEKNTILNIPKDLLNQYDSIRNSMGDSLLDEENKNLELAAISAQLVYYVNKITDSNYLALDEFCKSGKDRGGLLRLVMNIHATSLFITGDANLHAHPEQLKKIGHSLTAANQIGAQAGYSGNVLGAAGVLDSIKHALPKYLSPDNDAEMSFISKETAGFNKKIPEYRPFYKKGKFYLGVAGAVIGLALCATGIGAAIGAPILAGAIGGGLIATTGIAAGIAGIAGSLTAQSHSLRLFALGMAGIGAVLCLTGIGAIVGAPLVAAAITTVVAGASSTVIAGSTLLSATNKEQTPIYQRPKFWLALGATIVGAALCATGIGAIIGAPFIAATIATVGIGTGCTIMAGSVIKNKEASIGKKILAVLGGALGIGLCLTGIGAIAGVPLLATLGFLGTSTASTAANAANISASYLTAATTVATMGVVGGTATIIAAEEAHKQLQGEKVNTNYDTPEAPPGAVVANMITNTSQTHMHQAVGLKTAETRKLKLDDQESVYPAHVAQGISEGSQHKNTTKEDQTNIHHRKTSTYKR